MKTFRSLVTGLLLAGLCLVTGAFAQTGGGYDLTWSTVDGGGATFSTGGGYSLGATAGQPDAGGHAGAGYVLSGGFWIVDTATFTVVKDFSDNNTAAVTVALTCTAGVVSPPSALVSEATPAVFSVTGFTGAPNCTATEIVPPGYTVDQSGCAAVPLATGACTIVNTLKVAPFVVIKDFNDNNPAAVSISLACTSGVVSPASAMASEAVPANFTVSGYDGSPTCTATEAVPSGYTANQSGCAGVTLATGTCTIINVLNTANFTVAKSFSDNNPASVTVSLSCSSGVVSPASAPASQATPATFTVSGFNGAPTCTATETVPSGYTANQSGCAGVTLATGTCTISNMLNTANFTVAKSFSDNNPASVMVSLSCSSGVVSPASAPASQATPATFTVSGFNGAPNCTATESVPAGYSANVVDCAGVALAAGTCRIVNTVIPGTISIVLTTEPYPNADALQVSFTAGGGLLPASFTLTNGGVQTFSNVAPGSGYSVTTGIPPEWQLLRVSCSDGGLPTSIDVSRAETVTCTFIFSRIFPVPVLDDNVLLVLMLGFMILAALARRWRQRSNCGDVSHR